MMTLYSRILQVCYTATGSGPSRASTRALQLQKKTDLEQERPKPIKRLWVEASFRLATDRGRKGRRSSVLAYGPAVPGTGPASLNDGMGCMP